MIIPKSTPFSSNQIFNSRFRSVCVNALFQLASKLKKKNVFSSVVVVVVSFICVDWFSMIVSRYISQWFACTLMKYWIFLEFMLLLFHSQFINRFQFLCFCTWLNSNFAILLFVRLYQINFNKLLFSLMFSIKCESWIIFQNKRDFIKVSFS